MLLLRGRHVDKSILNKCTASTAYTCISDATFDFISCKNVVCLSGRAHSRIEGEIVKCEICGVKLMLFYSQRYLQQKHLQHVTFLLIIASLLSTIYIPPEVQITLKEQ